MRKAVSRTPSCSVCFRLGRREAEADSVQGGREDVLSHVASMVFSRCFHVLGAITNRFRTVVLMLGCRDCPAYPLCHVRRHSQQQSSGSCKPSPRLV